MAKYWGTPPFFTQNFFFQNDSEWLEMDFKHNFIIKCNILTRETPPQCNICYIFFLKASLSLVLYKNQKNCLEKLFDYNPQVLSFPKLPLIITICKNLWFWQQIQIFISKQRPLFMGGLSHFFLNFGQTNF